jgi:hypothetical protein
MSPETQALALEIEIKNLGFQVDRNMYRKIANYVADKIIEEYKDISNYTTGKDVSTDNAIRFWKDVKRYTNNEN